MSTLPSHPFQVRYGPDDPLDTFFLPACDRALRLDRRTGFASSTVLATAAAGLVRLIARGGRVRLIVGARLTPAQAAKLDPADPTAAVDRALRRDLRDLEADGGGSVRRRLEALAWMLAHRHLEIRVALPLDEAGVPLPQDAARPLLAGEEGVLWDGDGHQLAWSGSGEGFWTFATWARDSGRTPASPAHVDDVERRFAELWEGRRASWRVLALPAAVERRLLEHRPERAPRRAGAPPRQKRQPDAGGAAGELDERLLFRYLREVPHLPEARDLGVATAPITPWPHQLRVIRRLVDGWPQGFLLADEVGLGKTVEAGLALRQLVISGRVRRALVLVPRNLLRQWQEELFEKAALEVPRYDGGRFLDVRDRPVAPRSARAARRAARNAWNGVGLVLVSSHLARRRDRRAELLAADPWDLVIVDEAHQARRLDVRGERFRPNRLLELLGGKGRQGGLASRCRTFYLLTATPMQIHPVELWDLLRLLGLGGRWGAFEGDYLRYFEELRRPAGKRDDAFLLEMLADHLATGGDAEQELRRFVRAQLGESTAASLAPGDVARLAGRPGLGEVLRRCTPLRTFVERNTRPLLRQYHMQGLLEAGVPERRPENVWIELDAAERALYDRLDAYLTTYYRRFEARRRGLGFVMTVYRRRLTSSFEAVRRSLERRRAGLVGGSAEAAEELFGLEGGLEEGLDEAETALRLFDPDGDPDGDPPGELDELDRLLAELGELQGDTKTRHLVAELETLLAETEKAIVFTQYTDTLEALREALRPGLGDAVACYSGRGGERPASDGWAPVAKEEVKNAFRDGAIRVLLCTDAASEGLNLQTCGVLINFDMPWNPMRVEQRIGRIDRIGQLHPEVRIRNYFYAGTVEAEIYRRLGERIRGFEEVLGELQPILHRVGEALERVAMTPGARREKRLEEELTALVQAHDDGLDLDPGVGGMQEVVAAPEPPAPPPVDLAQLGEILTTAAATRERFTPDPELAGVFRLDAGEDGERRVTFDTEVFDRHPSQVELLTWGHPALDALLRSAAVAERSAEPRGLGLYRVRHPAPLTLVLRPLAGDARPVTGLEELRAAALAPLAGWSGEAESQAEALFGVARQRLVRRHRATVERLRGGRRRAHAAAARHVLRRAALVALATAGGPSLFNAGAPSFGREAVEALGQRGAPWSDLLELAAGEDLEVRPDDPFHVALADRSPEELERLSKSLAGEGRELVARHRLEGDLDRGGGEALVERSWFPLGAEDGDSDSEELPLRLVPPAELEPFANAVPLYRDLVEVVDRFGDEALGGDPQAAERENPAALPWVELAGRTPPSPGLFVARVVGEGVDRRVAAGDWALFRLAPRQVRPGQVVLARHPEVRDPDLGEATLRIYDTEERAGDGAWSRRVVLKPASTDPSLRPWILDDLEDGALRIVAELVEVL